MTDKESGVVEAKAGVPARAGLVLTALVLTAMVSNINIASATVALPAIAEAFDASQLALNLVGLGPGLGLSMSVLYFGAIADRFGRKQMLLTGLIALVIVSVLSAIAPTVEILIVTRVLTGIAAGMAFPTTLSLISALWEQGPRRTSAIAIWSSVGGMASVIGGVIAGLLLLWMPGFWGSVFLMSVPIALAALILVITVVPSHVDESTEPVDHVGGVLATLGVAALVLGISFVFAPAQHEIGVWSLIASAVLIVLFIVRQLFARNPLYDLRVVRRRMFWVPALAGMIVFGGLIGTMFVGEQFMQNVLQYSALGAGLAVIPAAVSLVITAPIAAQVLTRYGTRLAMLIGYVLVGIAFVTMLFWREETPYWLVGVGFFVIGSGVSFVISSASRALTSTTPVSRVGMASATSDLQADLGGSLMQGLLGAILAAGFAGSISSMITDAEKTIPGITDQITSALQSSYASALQVAQQYPQYQDGIIEAARESLVAGSLGAYLVGAVAVVIGLVLVLFGLPSHKKELELEKKYSALNANYGA